MAIMVRHIDPAIRVSEQQIMAMLERIIAQDLIAEIVATELPTKRCSRKLPAELTLLLAIAVNLWDDDGLEVVLVKLLAGLRLVWPDAHLDPTSKGGISQARSRLGARPVAALFHRVCRPLATPQTVGAFYGPWRLVAIDGATELTPATADNDHAFGRHHSQYGPAAYPLVLGVHLVEVGTHAIFDATFWPGAIPPKIAGPCAWSSAAPPRCWSCSMPRPIRHAI